MSRIGTQILLQKQLTQLKKQCYLINKRFTFYVYDYLDAMSSMDKLMNITDYICWKRGKWTPLISRHHGVIYAYGMNYHGNDRTISI